MADDIEQVLADRGLVTVSNDLARHIKEAKRNGDYPRFKQATVTAITGSSTSYTVTVNFANSAASLARIECLNCTPIVGDGVWIMELSPGVQMVIGSTGIQQPHMPHSKSLRRIIGVGNSFSVNSASYVVCPNASERPNLQLPFTKYRDDTYLQVDLWATCYMQNAIGRTNLGFTPNGVAMWDCGMFYFNNLAEHHAIVGTTGNISVGKGDYTIEPVFNVMTGGTMAVTYANPDDMISFKVTETL